MQKYAIVLFCFLCVTSCANAVSPDQELDCGNAILQPGEGCDDGNTEPGDGCDDRCQMESGWVCTGSPSVCSSFCGNGEYNNGEECDDGNTNDGDGCSAVCAIEEGWMCEGAPSVCVDLCGNGTLDLEEECDGELLGGATCEGLDQGFSGGTLGCLPSCTYDTSACISPNCGNGTVDAGEECDDGNQSNNDACLNNCRHAVCGDSFLWVGQEACDDGNASNTDECLTDCTHATCGDSFLWIGHETCDDGNTTDGDACDSLCQVEALPMMYTFNTLSGGWTVELITFAGEPHAPQAPIIAAANLQKINKAFVFTQSTYHLLSLPSKTWLGSGPIGSLFPGVPATSVTSAYGVSWDTNDESTVTFVTDSQAYTYAFNNATEQVTVDPASPVTIDWSGSAGDYPDPTQIRAMYVDLTNSQGWVTIDPSALCGATATETGHYMAALDSLSTFYTLEAGSCFEWGSSMPVTTFPPFSEPGAPTASQIRAAFFVFPSRYVIAEP